MHTAPRKCCPYPWQPLPLLPPRVYVLQRGKTLTASRSLLLLTCAPEWFSAEYLKRLSKSFINGEHFRRLRFSFVLLFWKKKNYLWMKMSYCYVLCLLDLSWKQPLLKRSSEKVACPLRRKKSECKFVISLQGGTKASSNQRRIWTFCVCVSLKSRA